MVKHNNAIPKAHFKKNWQRFVKTWFNQPAKKNKRKLNRMIKLSNSVKKNIYLEKIRPIVHCPTKTHNIKIKIGRGFSNEEIDVIACRRNYAKSFGILVDKRRRATNLGKKTNIIRLESTII